MDIRKISIGPDYKGGAMHYIVGQKILGDSNIIHLIKYEEQTSSILIYIINEKNEIVLWKQFNSAMPISIEFNINF
jgi:hypothetical protein